MPTTNKESRQATRQRIKQNIQRREERSGQAQRKERIEVDFFDSLREDNQKFFNLLDPGSWKGLKAVYADPSNSKELGELVGNLMSGGSM